MVPVQQDSDASRGELAVFLDQVEARCSRRVGAVDPLAELGKLGLLPAAGDVPVWAEMSAADWFVLLRGIARRDPPLAASLSSLHLAIDHADGPGTGWALHASGHAGHWRIRLPTLAEHCTNWVFCDGEQLRWVSTAMLRQTATDVFECDHAATVLAGSCSPSLLSSFWRDRLALINGCLWRLWTVTVDHAESRPMFRRHLGDFPAVRLRLLLLLAELLRADELAERAAAASPSATSGRNSAATLMGALRRCAETIRVETQQICGGSGYMRESHYAQALVWLDWCDGLMRVGPIADGVLAEPLATEIDHRLSERFRRAGISADRCAVLLRSPIHRRLAPEASRAP
jgi:alkylation response protein AidB-like acyl-CoA dehydrogenase